MWACVELVLPPLWCMLYSVHLWGPRLWGPLAPNVGVLCGHGSLFACPLLFPHPPRHPCAVCNGFHCIAAHTPLHTSSRRMTPVPCSAAFT